MPFIKNVAIFAKKNVVDVVINPFCEISAGTENLSNFSAGISKTGRAWAWGTGTFGRLGDNSTTDKCTPVSVAGAVKTFCKISTGNRHTIAIDKGGRVWAWGINSNNQLGDNTTTSRLTPISILGNIKTFCQIYASETFSLGITNRGRAWGWGSNSAGNLGDNTVTQRATPVSVAGGVKTFCKITAGQIHSLAIDKNGRVWSWGFNGSGRLGDNSITQRNTPVSVAGTVKTFCKIAASTNHSLAIDKNGRAWSWGNNGNGQLGNNTFDQSQITPVSIAGVVKTFCEIAAGNGFSVALDKNGRAWSWGYNISGMLGDNTTTTRRTPVSVVGTVKTFCKISAGYDNVLAIDNNGRVWGWGNNINGALGNKSQRCRITPVSVTGNRTFCSIETDVNDYNGIAIDKNGRLWSWGYNISGQLGDNSLIDKFSPVCVCGVVKTFCKITVGSQHAYGIDKNGRVWAWGNNGNSNLGLGVGQPSRIQTPRSIVGVVKTFCQISAGNFSALAIDKNGRLWAWGGNFYGEVGNNTVGFTTIYTPVSVCGAVKTFCKISAGSSFSLGITNRGRAWGWGYDSNYELGDNDTLSKLTPVSVGGVAKTFCEISGGNSHALAIDRSGRAWAWGSNTFGQIGVSAIASARTPVSVAGAIKTFCKISAGGNHSLAIDKNGRLWAWGLNTSGQLGDNTLTSRRTPVSILGGVKTFCHVSAGNTHSLAIDKNGRAWAWGDSFYGQIGDSINTRTPIRVCNI